MKRAWTTLVCGLLIGAGCGTPPKPSSAFTAGSSEDFERLMQSGQDAYRGGDLDNAGRRFQLALTYARERDRPNLISEAAYHLAAVQFSSGRQDDALALLAEAEWDAARVGLETADIELLRARILHRLGLNAEARQRLTLLISRSGLNPKTEVLAYLLMIESADRETTPEELRGWASRAELAQGRIDDPLVRGQVREAILSLEDAGDDPSRIAAGLDDAADSYREAGASSRLAGVLSRAGDQWAAAGRVDIALNRWVRAARSLSALGDETKAMALIEKCREHLHEIDDPYLHEIIEALHRELTAGTADR